MAALLAPSQARAQLSLPAAGPSGGGFAGVNSSGGYGASVPLDLPAARGGLPVPVQISYAEHGVGAAGRGWDVPLSYVRRDTTIVRRRPLGTVNVAPQGREQVTLVLDGRPLDLVHTASGWNARRDATDLQLREPGDGTWVMYDGQGRTYTFAAVAPALVGTGLWLLQDITGASGAKVHLEYTIATPTVSGNATVAIDLASVRYSPHSANAGCYKTTISLGYDGDTTPPLAVSILGSVTLARQHKLTTLDVLGKDSCSASDVRIRRYQLSYTSDPDTQLPRLASVNVLGQSGTPEATTAIPIASYGYGTASNAGRLRYQQVSLDNNSATSLSTLGTTTSSTPVVMNMGNGFSTTRSLLDMTGDGRPDSVTLSPDGSLSVYPNRSIQNQSSFAAARTLSDGVLSARAVETRTVQSTSQGSTAVAYSRVWRQAIDVNGDGRVDIIDAAEQSGHWVVYLNAPDPANPANVQWQRRSISITTLASQLAGRGMTESGFLPLSRRAAGSDGTVVQCYQWISNGPKPTSPGHWSGPVQCPPEDVGPLLQDRVITEWEVKDINGDGYPDVVFNSSPTLVRVRPIEDNRGPQGFPDEIATVTTSHTVELRDGDSNKLEAMFSVLGNRLTEDTGEPFSAPVTLASQEPCGLEQWAPDGAAWKHLRCGLADVNGDGILDRVIEGWVHLGTGALGGSFFLWGSVIALPGQLATQSTNQSSSCAAAPTFVTRQAAGLLDVTGDGIPDYVAVGGANDWSVWIGTGTGFAPPIPTDAGSASLPVSYDSCAGDVSNTKAGMVDLDGDGRLDAIFEGGTVYALTGSESVRGAPGAGRLVQISNGFGATTHIHYRSIKGDSGAMHQVPFAEVVVDSVDVTAAQGFGGSLSATRYAYGGSELLFDPARDRFTFPGYRRTVMLQAPVGQQPGIATATITDTYAPVSAADPYGITVGATLDATQRYAFYRRIGQIRDVTVLSGNLSDAAIGNPRLLLFIDVTSDSHRIAAAHTTGALAGCPRARILPPPNPASRPSTLITTPGRRILSRAATITTPAWPMAWVSS